MTARKESRVETFGMSHDQFENCNNKIEEKVATNGWAAPLCGRRDTAIANIVTLLSHEGLAIDIMARAGRTDGVWNV